MHEATLISVATVDAIERLYRSRQRYFLRVARAELGDGEAATDAVQEAFARAIRSRHSFSGSGSLDAWVWRILVNVCRNAQEAREPLVETASPGSEPLEAGEYARVRVAFKELPERQRLVLFLRYYADLDYARIGEVLGIERGTVAATIHAAHTRLRTILMEV